MIKRTEDESTFRAEPERELTQAEREYQFSALFAAKFTSSLPLFLERARAFIEGGDGSAEDAALMGEMGELLALYGEMFPLYPNYNVRDHNVIYKWRLAQIVERLMEMVPDAMIKPFPHPDDQYESWRTYDRRPAVRERLAEVLGSIAQEFYFTLPQSDELETFVENPLPFFGLEDETSIPIRFMPGFRALSWRAQPEAESMQLGYDTQAPNNDYLQLVKPGGRSFTLAHASGMYELEPHIREYLQTGVHGVLPIGIPHKNPWVLFDRDGTLKSVRRGDERNAEYEVLSREALLKLRESGIRTGLWTRAYPGEAAYFARYAKGYGATIYPAYDFGSWPGARGSHDEVKINGKKALMDVVRALSPETAATFHIYLAANWQTRDEQEFVERFLQFIKAVGHDEFYEAKSPINAALFDTKLTPEEKQSLIRDAILVNDNEACLAAAVEFGYSAILVNSPADLPRVVELILQMQARS